MASLYGNMLAQRNTNTTYTAASATPKAAGTAAVGTSAKYAREDHVHPLQTTVSGNAGSATKLATARTIGISGAVTGTATAFDGTKNITIPITALDVSKATTGILPVARGGTGQSTIQAVRKSITGVDYPNYDNLLFDGYEVNICNAGTFDSSGIPDGGSSALHIGAGTLPKDTATSGQECLIGDYAGACSLDVSGSVFIGAAAGIRFGEESGTVGIGTCCLNETTLEENSANNAVAIGNQCVYANGSQDGLTAIGSGVLYKTSGKITTTNCVFVGRNVMRDSTQTSVTNSIAIGYGSSVTGSNQFQLGNSGVTPYAYKALSVRSDARDKANITDLDYNYKEFISKLKPRNYQYDMREDYRITNDNMEKLLPLGKNLDNQTSVEQKPLSDITHDGTHIRTRRHNGFIAQEVKDVMDEMGFDFAGYDDHKVKGGDDVLSLGYEEFIAPMVACIQDLMKENEELKQKVLAIEAKLENI